MKWERFKNYGLWLSIFSFIPLLLNGFGVNILPEDYGQIVTALLGILVMAGIINNPTTDSKWYADDKLDTSENQTLEVKAPEETDNLNNSR